MWDADRADDELVSWDTPNARDSARRRRERRDEDFYAENAPARRQFEFLPPLSKGERKRLQDEADERSREAHLPERSGVVVPDESVSNHTVEPQRFQSGNTHSVSPQSPRIARYSRVSNHTESIEPGEAIAPLEAASADSDSCVNRFSRKEFWRRIESRNRRREERRDKQVDRVKEMLSPFIPVTAALVGESLFISRPTATRLLNELVEEGHARREGKTRGTKYFGCPR